jgi:hypothetical protein
LGLGAGYSGYDAGNDPNQTDYQPFDDQHYDENGEEWNAHYNGGYSNPGEDQNAGAWNNDIHADPYGDAHPALVGESLHDENEAHYTMAEGGIHNGAQAGYQHPAHSGYQHPAQSGYQHPSQSGYQHPSQSGYQHPSQSDYQHPSQGGILPVTHNVVHHIVHHVVGDSYQPDPQNGAGWDDESQATQPYDQGWDDGYDQTNGDFGDTQGFEQ